MVLSWSMHTSGAPLRGHPHKDMWPALQPHWAEQGELVTHVQRSERLPGLVRCPLPSPSLLSPTSALPSPRLSQSIHKYTLIYIRTSPHVWQRSCRCRPMSIGSDLGMTSGVRKRRQPQAFWETFAFDLYVASWSLTSRELPSAPSRGGGERPAAPAYTS